MNRTARDAPVDRDRRAVDRPAVPRPSREIAWIVAGAAVAFALAEALALLVFVPMKSVTPYTLMVDRDTGVVQALKPLDVDRSVPGAALTESLLVQYVVARESFDIDDAQTAYRRVVAWSAPDARADYAAMVQDRGTTAVATMVRSVSRLGDRIALVRFETQRRGSGARSDATQAWVAVIRYRFDAAALGVEQRLANPLGFQVVDYRRSVEAAALPEPVATDAPVVVVPGRTPTLVPLRRLPQATPVQPPPVQRPDTSTTPIITL